MFQIPIKNNKENNADASKIHSELTKLVSPKKKAAFQILYNGSVLTMPSGKSVWNRLGDAKSALWNAMTMPIHKMMGPDFWKEDIDIRNEKIQKAKELLFSFVEIKELK